MSLGCPLNTLSHCISQVGLLTAGSAAVGGSPLIETSTVVTDGQMQSALFAISSSNRKENLVVSIDSDFLTEGFHTISKASAKWTSWRNSPLSSSTCSSSAQRLMASCERSPEPPSFWKQVVFQRKSTRVGSRQNAKQSLALAQKHGRCCVDLSSIALSLQTLQTLQIWRSKKAMFFCWCVWKCTMSCAPGEGVEGGFRVLRAPNSHALLWHGHPTSFAPASQESHKSHLRVSQFDVFFN